MRILHQPKFCGRQIAITNCVGFMPRIPPGSVGQIFGAYVRDGQDKASMRKPHETFRKASERV